MKFNSLKTKFGFTVSITAFILFASIVTYSVISARKKAIENAENKMVLLAEKYAFKIKAEIELAMNISNNLASTFTSLRQSETIKIDRAGMNKLLVKSLNDNPSFFGICTLWEPNAFDNKDSKFANTKGHDSTGRFIPYWTRHNKNKFILEPLVEYTIDGSGVWYLIPKRTKKEIFLGPYNYKVQGKNVFMASSITPILINNEFQGIIGVDITIDFLQKYVKNAKDEIFKSKVNISIIGNNGTYAANTLYPGKIGKNITEYFDNANEQLQLIKEGKIQKYYQNNNLEVQVPIFIGKTITPWQVRISIADNIILADAKKQMWNLIILGLILVLFLYISKYQD